MAWLWINATEAVNLWSLTLVRVDRSANGYVVVGIVADGENVTLAHRPTAEAAQEECERLVNLAATWREGVVNTEEVS